MRLIKKLLAIALTAITLYTYAQDTEFVPFVSSIKTAVKGTQIKILWKDAEGLTGEKYRIYRATQKISDTSFTSAILAGVVGEDVGFFIDTPPESGSYYYTILVVDSTGTEYKIFIPFRNTSISPITIDITQAKEEITPAELLSFSAQAKEKEVILNFKASRSDRNLIIYRSTQAFTSPDSIKTATKVTTIASSETTYTDYPVPGIDYYYAIADENSKEITFIAGKNTILEPVKIELQKTVISLPKSPDNNLREAPLPNFTPNKGKSAKEELPKRKAISKELQESVKRIISSLPVFRPVLPSPELLPEEKDTTLKGTEASLRTLVANIESTTNWEALELQLYNLLATTSDKDIEARIYFYLGQALFFEGKREQALLSFIKARDKYYLKTEIWITAILNPEALSQPTE